MINSDIDVVQTIVPHLAHTIETQFSETTRKMCFQLLSTFDKSHNIFSTSSSLQDIKNFYEEKERREKLMEEQKQKKMSEKKSGLRFLDFGLGKILGEGSYARVRYALLIDSNVDQRFWQEYAIKIMDKALLEEQKYMDNALLEIEIMETISHPNLVNLISFFEDDRRFFLVMEYASQGDVFSRWEKLGSVDIDWARYVIASVVLAIEHLHAKGYVHLDIKPEVS